jgi:hypothetical protein
MDSGAKDRDVNKSVKVERRIWFFLVVLGMTVGFLFCLSIVNFRGLSPITSILAVGLTFVLAFTMYFSKVTTNKLSFKDGPISKEEK